jgi:cyclase
MLEGMNRRRFLGLAASATAATIAPRWSRAQASPANDRIAAARTQAQSTPIRTAKLSENVYLLQGAGGNMVLQTGPEGNILIDSSFSTAGPRIREAIAAVSKAPAFALINTHWHFDHTDGNEGMHAAGFTVVAHRNTRERLAKPESIRFFQMSMPPAPAGALPTVTFDRSMNLWRNGDTLDLVHFEPAHTDSDIFIHFHKADVLHLGDIWFNGMYPFIDADSGGSIGGMIRAGAKALAVAGDSTKIVPGHGPLGTKAELKSFHEMLAGVRDKVAALKAAGANEQEAIAKKPTAEFDAAMGTGMMSPDQFAGLVYRTL